MWLCHLRSFVTPRFQKQASFTDIPNKFKTCLKYLQNGRQCLKVFDTLRVICANAWKGSGGWGICSNNVRSDILQSSERYERSSEVRGKRLIIFSIFGRLRGNFDHLRISQITVSSLRDLCGYLCCYLLHLNPALLLTNQNEVILIFQVEEKVD